MHRQSILWLLLLIPWTLCGQGRAQNLIANPSFELGKTDPDGWEVANWDPPHITMRRDTNVAHFGWAIYEYTVAAVAAATGNMLRPASEWTVAPGTPFGLDLPMQSFSLLTIEPGTASNPHGGFRGVYFNPQIGLGGHYPWMVHYAKYRDQIRESLQELVDEAGLNLVTIYVPMCRTLLNPTSAPQEAQALTDWANVEYLDNVAAFVDDCHDAGLEVELDAACTLWVPYAVDTKNHVANSGRWPVPDDTPWDEAAQWYREVITYIEGHAKHPENIAMWAMMGNYALGSAEPVLWDCPEKPAIMEYTEQFVKRVWPVFRAAGTRPKAAPYAFPIFSNDPYWMAKSPEERLSGFTNLKKWLIDDLDLPPDYWPMSTYPFCEPASDGVHYLERIVEILGNENASRILSTDLKGPGHDQERAGSIISAKGYSGADMLQWHFDQGAKFGFAGWWIWAYQDMADTDSAPTGNQKTGIRTCAGAWKPDLLEVIRRQAVHRLNDAAGSHQTAEKEGAAVRKVPPRSAVR